MQVTSNEKEWLSIFFDSPNDIGLTPQLDWKGNGSYSETTTEVQLWIELFTLSQKQTPFVVPFAKEKEIIWYACCENRRQKDRTVEEIKAFVQNAYAHIKGFYSFDNSNPCEAAIKQRFGQNTIRIEVIPGNEKKFLEIISLYRHILSRRPKEEKKLIRPSGRIRYEFEQALAAGDDFLAGKCIDELRSTGRLDQQNQRFMEIRRYASFGKWDLLVSNPEFLRSVVDLHLPTQIQSDLIEALYFTFLYPFELENEPEKAIVSFNTNILQKYAKLFKSRRGIKSPIILKAFLINELARGEASFSHCKSILDDYDRQEPGYNYAVKLLESISDKRCEKDGIKQAEDAFENENFDFAFSLFLNLEPTRKILQRILYCTHEIQSLKAFNEAWDYCQEVPDKIISSLPPKSRKLFSNIEERFADLGTQEVGDWCQLFEYVLNGGDENRGIEFARQGCEEWSSSIFLNDQGKLDNLSSLLLDCLDSKLEFFKKVLPTFYNFFFENEKKGGDFKGICLLLVQYIALFDSWNSSELSIFYDLVRVLLDAGPTDSEYNDFVVSISEIHTHVKSLKNLTWALDISELLAIYPAPQGNNRIALFSDICGLLGEIKHRVSKEEWLTLDLLAKDYGVEKFIDGIRPDFNENDVSGELNEKLVGKKLGIYTLTEPAGIRAKKILSDFYPAFQVETNCDHEATERLVNLAKSSDFFVFAWKSAKHQAFNCIQMNMKNRKDLIMPPGKGSTSIVRSVKKFLEERFYN